MKKPTLLILVLGLVLSIQAQVSKTKISSANNGSSTIQTSAGFTIVDVIAADIRFSLFYEALQQTGLSQKLLLMKDENYNPENYKSMLYPPFTQGSGSIDGLPFTKKYGYTLLMESDATYKDKYGIENIGQLKEKAKEIYDPVYPDDANVTDVTDPRNSLNRYIAYHVINKRLNYSKFINDYDTQHMLKTYDMYEYIETMCPNTLMEVRIVRSSPGVNYFNMINSTADAIQIVRSNSDNDATNGVYHEIDKILAYDINVSTHMSGIRLRMDAASFFPELTNNNMRGNGNVQSWIIPKGYLERFTCAEGTVFTYLNSYGGYLDYQGDEVFFKGSYDFSIVTPPIPAGTYEVRFGYCPTGGRGAAQFYWDNVPQGIPLDLRVTAANAAIGYIKPGIDVSDPSGYINDKKMREKGYMKGPSTYKDYINRWYGGTVARNSVYALRRIIGTFTFNKSETHVFTVKSVMEGQFMLDYLEFVPVSLLDTENVE